MGEGDMSDGDISDRDGNRGEVEMSVQKGVGRKEKWIY